MKKKRTMKKIIITYTLGLTFALSLTTSVHATSNGQVDEQPSNQDQLHLNNDPKNGNLNSRTQQLIEDLKKQLEQKQQNNNQNNQKNTPSVAPKEVKVEPKETPQVISPEEKAANQVNLQQQNNLNTKQHKSFSPQDVNTPQNNVPSKSNNDSLDTSLLTKQTDKAPVEEKGNKANFKSSYKPIDANKYNGFSLIQIGMYVVGAIIIGFLLFLIYKGVANASWSKMFSNLKYKLSKDVVTNPYEDHFEQKENIAKQEVEQTNFSSQNQNIVNDIKEEKIKLKRAEEIVQTKANNSTIAQPEEEKNLTLNQMKMPNSVKKPENNETQLKEVESNLFYDENDFKTNTKNNIINVANKNSDFRTKTNKKSNLDSIFDDFDINESLEQNSYSRIKRK